jgi:hypothetical protein
VIVSPAVPLTRLGATNSLAGVKSGCLEFLVTILTDLCFHRNSVREFSRVCRDEEFDVTSAESGTEMVQARASTAG